MTCLIGILMIAILLSGIVALGVVAAGSGDGPGPGETASPGRLSVTDRVSVVLPAGWEEVERFDDGVRVGQGNVAVDIVVSDAAPPEDVIRSYVEDVLVPDATVFSSTDPLPTEILGRPAARASYVGRFRQVASPLEGRLAAIAYDDLAVLVDAWAAEGSLGAAEAQIEAIVSSIEVGG